jgi:hypothetical protein
LHSLGRPGRAAFAAALLICAAAVLWWTRGAAPLAYLPAAPPGEWIVYPIAARTSARPAAELEATFHRSFQLGRTPQRAQLDLRPLGRGEVEINGRVALGASSLEHATSEVASLLREGRNTVVARVRRDRGPPALNLSLALPDGEVLATDTRWRVSLAGATWRPARTADDLDGLDAPTPDLAPLSLLVFAALSALLFALGSRGGCAPPVPAAAALAVAAAAWLALFTNHAGQDLHLVGFDAHHHLAYVRYVFERGALPLPSDGALMYHPPLFYALCAGLLRSLGLDPADPAAVNALRGFTFTLGVAHVAGLYGCVRLLLPGRERAQALALVFAACLPMHLYLFSYLTNETLSAALGTASVYLLLRVLRTPAPHLGAYVALGTLLGLALLTKVSALLLVPLAAAALVAAHPRRWPCALLSIAIAAILGGWHYARVAWAFGNPLIGNWDPAVGFSWWQDPGYRSAAQYWRFGRALVDPWFAGMHGVPDGLYSTFWGDGLAGGATQRSAGPPWNAGLMRQGYWLAAAPGLALAIGVGRGLAAVARRPSAQNLFLALLALGMAAATFYMTLRVPSYAQTKAFYAHLALVPACAAFALGADWMLRRSRNGARFFSWALLVWALNAYASFWIVGGSSATLLQNGERALAAGNPARAGAAFERVLHGEPDRVEAHVGLCRVSVRQRDWSVARARCEATLARAPQDPEVLFQLARIDVAQGESDRALERLQRLRERTPDDPRPVATLAALLAGRGDDAAAAAVARDWLRFAPGDPRPRALIERAGAGALDPAVPEP